MDLIYDIKNKIKFYWSAYYINSSFIIINFICTVIFLILFNMEYRDIEKPIFFITVYLFTLFNFIFSLISRRDRHILLLFILLYLRLFIIIFILYPLENKFYLMLLLFFPLLLESGFNFSITKNLINTVLVILITIFFLNINPLLGTVAFGTVLKHGSIFIPNLFFIIVFNFTGIVLFRFFYKIDENKKHVDKLNNSVHQLIKANQDFQNYSASIKEIVILNERKRISRDIHDSVGHLLTNIIAMSDLILSLGNSNIEQQKEISSMIREEAQKGLEETRKAMRELRIISTEEKNAIKNIYKLVRVFQTATKIKVDIDFTNFRWSYGNNIDFLIYHVIQEGLTNSFRHGVASNVHIHLYEDVTVHKIVLNITDNGTGSSDFNKGLGLQGMYERLQKIGGKVYAGNTENGFKLTVIIPIKK